MNSDINSGSYQGVDQGFNRFTREQVFSGMDLSLIPEGMDVNQVMDDNNYDDYLATYPADTPMSEIRSDLAQQLVEYDQSSPQDVYDTSDKALDPSRDAIS